MDGLGAGDTSLVLDFLPAASASSVFSWMLPRSFPSARDAAVQAETVDKDTSKVVLAGMPGAVMVTDEDVGLHEECDVQWQEMHYYGQPVPRLVCVQGEHDVTDGAVPMYRHPVDTQLPVHEFSPAVLKIVGEARKAFGFPFNHALIQLYRSGQDSIAPHTDKTLDIAHDTPIVNISFGASRCFLIRSKAKLSCGTGKETNHNVTLPHNSALVFGLKSNRLFTHQIHADKRPNGQRRCDETGWDGVRISLTLRVVATFQRLDGLLYGQGATLKTAAALDRALASGQIGAGTVSPEEKDIVESESTRMAEAFRQENTDPAFDWETNYGVGFDLLAPVTYAMKPSTLPILRK